MTLAVAVDLPALRLSDDEKLVLGKLRNQLANAQRVNAAKTQYYEGWHKARNLEIAVPPTLADLDVFVGYAGTVVDVLAERIAWDMWKAEGPSQYLTSLNTVYAENFLDVEQSQVTVDSLVAGVSFVTVGIGADDEPDLLVTGESPNAATVLWDSRKRRVSAGLSQTRDDAGIVQMETLYLPNSTIRLQRKDMLSRVEIVGRDDHNRGRVPMVRFPNRERASDKFGRSEITKPIRYYTDAAARTLLGMEINREFYTAPQRYGLGLDPAQFGIDPDQPRSERVRKGWEASMSRMLFAPYNDDVGDRGVMPQLGQFAAAPPTPYIEQNKHYALLIASEAGIPPNSMGFTSQNPPSGDSIRALEVRLTKRAEFRQRMQGRAWMEVAYLALLWRDGAVDRGEFAKLAVNWLDPSTPTPAADMDEAVKGVGAGIYPPDSVITYRKVGLSEKDQAQIAVDKRRGSVSSVMDRLSGAAQAAQQDPRVNELASRRADLAE